MITEKRHRTLEIFFRGIRGEDLSPVKLATEYGVSTKSITRNINEIKEFLAENRELVGHTELEYTHTSKAYRLFFDEFYCKRRRSASCRRKYFLETEIYVDE